MEICEPIKIGVNQITMYNTHNPHKFVKELSELSDDDLFRLCKDFIWFSAYANNNPRSDYHFMCDACYEECKRREKPDIYNRAYTKITRSI